MEIVCDAPLQVLGAEGQDVIGENGKFSPMCPMMILRAGRRSNKPETIKRRQCIPVSACQPHADVESRNAAVSGNPLKYA
jgi:hypothetical protein